MIRLTNEQWERIRKHFPEEHIPDGRPGRKPIPTRHVLEAVLWILNTGARWHMLPQSYPNYKTVHRPFQAWCCNEVLRRVLTDVANDLRDKGALDEEECFIDATFVMAKGGGSEVETTEARERHENHGDCGSPWIATLGQHACGEPSRSPLSAAMLRLLHDRSQAREFDRREPLEFLMAIYRDHWQPMSRRMKAAIEAAQYRHPKLGAIATTNLDSRDFAALLDRAIERSNGVREVKQIRRALPKPE